MNLDFNGHAVFSPSSSAMWLNCPASLLLNMKMREQQGDNSSEYAAQGTVAHELAELWLTTGRKPIELIDTVKNQNGYDILIDEEMLDYVAEYVNWCNDQQGDKYVEVKVDFSHLVPIKGQYGTSDHVCCSDKRLTITDLKYGMGIKVYAENNTQMQIYALGALAEYGLLYDFEEVEMRICQPRMKHFDSWVIPVKQLLEFGDYVEERAERCFDKNPDFAPSEKACQWCRVKATCPAKLAEIEKMVDDVFSNDDIMETVEKLNNDEFFVEEPDISLLTIEQQEKIFAKSKSIVSFLDKIEKNLFDFALKGGKLSEYKLVAGRKTRSWVDESAISAYFDNLGISEDEYNPRSLVSVAGAEKLLKSRKLSNDELLTYVADRDGKPTLAPLSDKRKVYEPDNGVQWD